MVVKAVIVRRGSALLVEGLSAATLGLVLLQCLAGLLCAACVLRSRFKTYYSDLVAVLDVNSVRGIRLLLVAFAVLCCVVELLRLPLLRREGWLFSSVAPAAQADVCKAYLVLSQGLLQPCFLLTALFLVHGSLRAFPSPSSSGKWALARVFVNILLCCLPVLLMELGLLLMAPYLRTRFGDVFLPSYLFQSSETVIYGGRTVSWCRFPLWSTMLQVGFGIIYGGYFLGLCWKMAIVAINKRLQFRVYALAVAVVVGVLAQVLLLGGAALQPRLGPKSELLSFLGFVMNVLCIALGQGILVVRPVFDTLAVGSAFDSVSDSSSSHLLGRAAGASSFSSTVEVFPLSRSSSQEYLLAQSRNQRAHSDHFFG